VFSNQTNDPPDDSDFTGISAPYEPPLDAELHIKTAECDVTEAVRIIIGYLQEKGYIS
jgi:adenylylsulfate kinase